MERPKILKYVHSVAKVYAVFPFYDVKCLCSGGREWGREEKFMVEKSGVEKFKVEKSGIERSGVEAWGWDVLKPNNYNTNARKLTKNLVKS